MAKAVAKKMPDVTTLVNGAVREVIGDIAEVELAPEEVNAIVKSAVKAAVKEVVQDVVEQSAGKEGGGK